MVGSQIVKFYPPFGRKTKKMKNLYGESIDVVSDQNIADNTLISVMKEER